MRTLPPTLNVLKVPCMLASQSCCRKARRISSQNRGQPDQTDSGNIHAGNSPWLFSNLAHLFIIKRFETTTCLLWKWHLFSRLCESYTMFQMFTTFKKYNESKVWEKTLLIFRQRSFEISLLLATHQKFKKWTYEKLCDASKWIENEIWIDVG